MLSSATTASESNAEGTDTPEPGAYEYAGAGGDELGETNDGGDVLGEDEMVEAVTVAGGEDSRGVGWLLLNSLLSDCG
jgi:hypothetical protein